MAYNELGLSCLILVRDVPFMGILVVGMDVGYWGAKVPIDWVVTDGMVHDVGTADRASFMVKLPVELVAI